MEKYAELPIINGYAGKHPYMKEKTFVLRKKSKEFISKVRTRDTEGFGMIWNDIMESVSMTSEYFVSAERNR